jgi:hypothetical protein
MASWFGAAGFLADFSALRPFSSCIFTFYRRNSAVSSRHLAGYVVVKNFVSGKTAAFQNLRRSEALGLARQRLGVRLSSAAFQCVANLCVYALH